MQPPSESCWSFVGWVCKSTADYLKLNGKDASLKFEENVIVWSHAFDKNEEFYKICRYYRATKENFHCQKHQMMIELFFENTYKLGAIINIKR